MKKNRTLKSSRYRAYVQNYMYGDCAYLAAAIHHKYGLPLAMIVASRGALSNLSHAWVMLPNGLHLDIEGEKTLEQLVTFCHSEGYRYTYQTHLNLSLQQLEDLINVKMPITNRCVQYALKVAETYLSDLLPTETSNKQPK